MTPTEIQNEIVKEFSALPDWLEKYQHLIELGKSLPALNKKYQIDEYLMKGCQVRTWLKTFAKNGRLSIESDSDSPIVKGLISLLIRIFNNQPCKEIKNAELFFINQTGFAENFSPTRANSLSEIIKQIKLAATDNPKA